MMDLKGKVMVITGAGSGFGREFARLGARQGARLVLADVQQDALDAVSQELSEQGAEVLAQRTNVAKAEEIASLAAATMQRFGAVHVLFNNAGRGNPPGEFTDWTAEQWREVVDVNLNGTMRVCAAARAGLAARRGELHQVVKDLFYPLPAMAQLAALAQAFQFRAAEVGEQREPRVAGAQREGEGGVGGEGDEGGVVGGERREHLEAVGARLDDQAIVGEHARTFGGGGDLEVGAAPAAVVRVGDAQLGERAVLHGDASRLRSCTSGGPGATSSWKATSFTL